MTHDYKRNGTSTLFAALNTLNGRVIRQHERRHRHQEWLKFLKLLDAQSPPDKQVHVIADNYGTHKHPKVRAWLKRNPRFHMHFTPTSASWLNRVERSFRDLTENPGAPGRQLPERGATYRRDRRVHHASQSGPQAVPLDGQGR